MKATWKIGRSHVESDATIVQDVRACKIEWPDDRLAVLPLSTTKSDGAVKRIPVMSQGLRVQLTVPATFYFDHIDGLRKVYLWMSDETDGEVGHRLCNQFLLTGRHDRRRHDGEDVVDFDLEALFRKNFTTVDELLQSQEARPDGDFVNENCGCRGERPGPGDWLRRVIRKSPYVYAISATDGAETQQINDVRVRPPLFLVTRVTREGRVDWQCACGSWTEVHPRDRGKEDITPLGFRDSRSAHDHMRRLRNGVPQNWEVVVAALSLVSGVALLIGEVIIPLASSCD